MSKRHTLESLTALEDTPDGYEQMRIIAAGFDGMVLHPNPYGSKLYWHRDGEVYAVTLTGKDHYHGVKFLPDYPASIDAVFAAEERIGLHAPLCASNAQIFAEWNFNAVKLLRICRSDASIPFGTTDICFLKAFYRCILFILTAQHLQEDNNEDEITEHKQ